MNPLTKMCHIKKEFLTLIFSKGVIDNIRIMGCGEVIFPKTKKFRHPNFIGHSIKVYCLVCLCIRLATIQGRLVGGTQYKA